MMKEKRERSALRATGEDAFFAASNSESGFHSYYEECFGRADINRVYVIKGGPGTGKSHFMRTVSQCGVANGWRCRMIYCSSDADSLDGVILSRGGESVALLDGTSPHVYEPRLPGVREDWINLGAFWDHDRLQGRREEIEACNRIKGEGYRRAYRYLSAYGSVQQCYRERVLPYLKRERMRKYAQRLLSLIPSGEKFQCETALIRSVGMKGTVGFDTYLSQASRIYLIRDCRGCGAELLGELYRLCEEKRLHVRVSRDPITPDLLDGILLRESGVAFVMAREEECVYPYQRICVRRFLDASALRNLRETLNHDERMCRALLGGVTEEMATVREAHFRLEAIYAEAMDFEKKERFTNSFCNQLFHLQNP